MARSNNDNINPLRQEVVLRKIFGYLTHSELKNCREVSTQWNDVSCRKLRKAANGYIRFGYCARPNGFTEKCYSIQDMDDFIDCVNASTNFPFTEFKIDTSITTDEILKQICFNRFLNFISPWMTGLMITDGFAKQHLRKKWPADISFPSLKTLSFHFDSCSYTNCPDHLQISMGFISTILKNSPSLEQICVKCVTPTEIGLPLLTTALKNAAALNQISHLSLNCLVYNTHLSKLADMKLQLKHLDIKITNPNGSAFNYLRNFLTRQSSSLEEYALSVSHAVGLGPRIVEFPGMSNLKKIIIDMRPPFDPIRFPTISYVDQFPKLESLVFSDDCYERYLGDFFKQSIQPSKTVKELELPEQCGPDSKLLLGAARLFPRLRKLVVPSSCKNTVDVVHEFWPMLEELVIKTSSWDPNVNDVVTGLHMGQYRQLAKLEDDVFQRRAEKFRKETGKRGISCLENLKILRVQPCSRTRRDGGSISKAKLTDAACRYEIMKMPSLKFLDFGGRLPSPLKISPEVLDEMKRKFVVLH